jgi:hypothetical protein
MKRNISSLSLPSVLALQAHAQSHTPTASSTPVSAAWQFGIFKVEQIVDLVRRSHRDEVSNDLREKLLPSKESDDVLNQSG